MPELFSTSHLTMLQGIMNQFQLKIRGNP